MDNKVNYTIVGLFVVILASIAVFLAFWLSGGRNHKIYDYYLVRAQDSISGLVEQTPVEFNGVPVGYVVSIRLAPRDPQIVELLLEIERGTPITVTTKATLVPQGVTGIVYVGLEGGAGNQPLLATPGEKYPIIPYKRPFLSRITDVLPEIADNVQELVKRFSLMFNQRNIAAFSRSLASLQVVLQYTETAGLELQPAIREISPTLQAVQRAAIAFQQVSVDMHPSLHQTAAVMQNVNQQVVPTLQQTLKQLNALSIQLQQVTNEIERNPAVLLRGKQALPPGPGE